MQDYVTFVCPAQFIRSLLRCCILLLNQKILQYYRLQQIRGPIWIETDKNGFSVIVVYLTNRPIYPPIFIRLYIRIGYIRINWYILYEFVKYTTITEIRFYPFLSVSDLQFMEYISKCYFLSQFEILFVQTFSFLSYRLVFCRLS